MDRREIGRREPVQQDQVTTLAGTDGACAGREHVIDAEAALACGRAG